MSRLGDLTAKVDAFFVRAEARHGDDMQCHTGCSDCCHVRLSITTAEAQAIADHLEALPGTGRADLAAHATAAPADHCAALGPDGRCRIYDVRPIVCRSHGAPIRMRRESLPVIESCYRNFLHTTPDPSCVLDQETLSALTLAVDQAEGGDGSRIDLADLLIGVYDE